jgi:dihydroxyacetone kinase-like protein
MLTKAQILHWLERTAEVMKENQDYLTDLDSAIGDADHGANMVRGFNKVQQKLPDISETDIGNILKTTGMTLMSSIGGASGPLYGTFFLRAGAAVAGKEVLSLTELQELLTAGVGGILQRGRPERGDKTMYDAWAPALEALTEGLQNDEDLMSVLQSAVLAAYEGMKATIPMQARKGRASYLGERSIGHQDPGATSSWLMLKALLSALTGAD